MDVMTIQWGFIGGKKKGVVPPTPTPSNVAGGFVIHPYHKKEYGDDDFAIVLSVLELLDDEQP